MGDEGRELPAEVAAIRERIAAALAAVGELRIADFERGDTDARDVLLPATIEQLDDAMQILGDCIPLFEGTEPMAEPAADAAGDRQRLCQEVERRLDALSERRHIADLAFVARLGLHGRRERLGQLLLVDDRWRLIAESSSGLREVVKSLSAVSMAIGRIHPSAVDESVYLSELARSLRVRQAYVDLLRYTAGLAGEHDAAGVAHALREAGTSLALLMSTKVYADFRIHDRMQMRGFQERIVEWLAAHEANVSERAHRAGARLLQDWVGFTELLGAVNNRWELREHDAQLLQVVVRRLEGLPPDTAVPMEQTMALAAVFGRDDELDRLTRAEPPGPVGPLVEAIRRALDRLGHRGPGREEWGERPSDGDFL